MTENIYDSDISAHGDYIYTNFDKLLSSKLANTRIKKAIGDSADFKGKDVIDIGSGDGSFSYELIEHGAASVLGIDPSQGAVSHASKKYAHVPNMKFLCHDVCSVPVPEKKFDIAVMRAVIHHMPDVSAGIKATCGLAKQVVVSEPNGYNPVLKIIEKTSSYHIAHEEKSYFPHRLRNEFKQCGATFIKGQYVNLVPFFCPDWFAKFLNKVAPLVESIPLVRNIACGQYVIHFKVDA